PGNRRKGLPALLAITWQASMLRSVLRVPLLRLLFRRHFPAFIGAIHTSPSGNTAAVRADLRFNDRLRSLGTLARAILTASQFDPVSLDCECLAASETRTFGASGAVVPARIRAVLPV